MYQFLMQTYTIVLPIALGYIVWLLQNQKKSRDANSEGTKCLLRVKLIGLLLYLLSLSYVV